MSTENSDDIENQFMSKLLDAEAIKPPNCPFDKINIFSRILFFWINPLLKKAQKRDLTQEDIFLLHKKETSQYNFEKFDQVYKEVQNDPKKSNKIRSTFFEIYKKEIIITMILYFLYLTSNIMNMYAVQLLLKAFGSPSRGESFSPLIMGLIFLFFVYLFQSIAKSNYSFYYSILTVRMTGALSMKVFQKTLIFPMQRNQFYKLGDILNMIQVDILQIVSYTQNVFTIIFVFPFATFAFYLCYDQVQNTSIILVMLASVVIFFSIYLLFGKLYGTIQKRFMHEKDLRMRSLEEMMRGIKTIKYNCLEDFFDERIKKKREKEVKQLRNQNFLGSLNNFVSNVSSTVFIMTITATFGINSLGDFLMINSSFKTILGFLMVLPMSIQGVVVGSNSMKRVNNFLTESFVYQQMNTYESKQIIQLNKKKDEKAFSITIKNASFYWKNSIDIDAIQDSVTLSKKERLSLSKNDSDIFKIKNLNIEIKTGEYIVFYGDLGSGKSSILQGILGEMEVNGGEEAFQKMVKINGSISLCTQDPWILQDTVKENILFGQTFDEERYQQVLNSSCLEEDIAYFVDGDQTNIGEKGDTLSGGQRKRVNLARTIYKDADIYLLDDPLSALDIGVATYIARECFEGMLKSKTRVIFTNNLVGMDKADRIFVVKNGQIVNEGKYSQIKRMIATGDNKNYDDEQEKIEEQQEIQQTQKILKRNKQPQEKQTKNQNNGYTKKLIKQEEIQQGTIKLDVFKEFLKNIGGVYFLIVVAMIISSFVVCNTLSRQMILDVKSDASESEQYRIMITYCLFDASKAFSVLLYECLVVFRMISLSKFLHKSIVFSLLRASFSKFYNSITTGRLMNRLSKDIYYIDMLIPLDLQAVINSFGTIINALILTIIVCTMTTIPIAISYFFLSIFLAYFFLKAKRQIVRIEATSKSPILQYFSEVIRGVVYLRNCVDYSKIKDTYQGYVDVDLRNQIVMNGVQYWFECITSFIGIFPILIPLIIAYYDTDTSPNIAVLMAVQISDFSSSFVTFAQTWISYETHLVNFERCFRLKQSIVLESYDKRERMQSSLSLKSNSHRSYSYGDESQLDESFVSQNEGSSCQSIKFQNASFQYRADIPNCLSNLNIQFNGKEKIGIVGRTGAGKTSITLALTKVIDLVSGDVKINGKSIQDYSLYELRNTISVVSQEPYIFEGSLKYNLDPYEQYSDQDIINVYSKCGFSSCHSFRHGLKTEITQLGDNLSEGEKQLISIGRIILRKSNIVIVDEPTSHIDASLEEHITNILNESFKDCLMITIAHKIKTIMNSDKILVLDHGKVQEFDHPQKLLSNENSLFSGIINMINQNAIN